MTDRIENFSLTGWSEISTAGSRCCSCPTHTCSLNEATEATEATPLIRSSSFRSQTSVINFDRIWLACLGLIMVIGLATGFYLLYLEKQNNLPAKIDVVSRLNWNAEAPKYNLTNLILPIEEIIIFRTNTKECENRDQCVFQMKNIQKNHMEMLNQTDILFNFVVGGDGRIYEGRGWENASLKERNNSLTVALLGNFTSHPPSQKQIEVLIAYLDYAVVEKMLIPCYQVLMDHFNRRFFIDLANVIKLHVAEQTECKMG